MLKRHMRKSHLLSKKLWNNFKQRNVIRREHTIGRTSIEESHTPFTSLPCSSDDAHLKMLNSLNLKTDIKEIPKEEEDIVEGNYRINDFGIQMINEELFKVLFKNCGCTYDKSKVGDFLKELKANDLLVSKTKVVPNVDLKLPELCGETIEEHFYKIATKQSHSYRKLLVELLHGIPERPINWKLQSGWTRYDGKSVVRVEHPLEDAMVLDVEACLSAGVTPTVATAVTPKAWYAWVNKNVLTGIGSAYNSISDLIPLESSLKQKGYDLSESLQRPKIAVGHNVSYDRSKVKEQYWIEQTGMRFLDTMSLHICVSGITSQQKALLKAGVGEEEWTKVSSLNSLSKVHELYCGTEISKVTRDLFVTGSLKDIKDNFQEAMSYCASDVVATYNVLRQVFPLFQERFPHPVTFAGMLEIQTAYLPVNKNWTKYLADSHDVYEDLDLEAKCLMTQSANDVCQLLHNDSYKEDLWLWDQDWSCKKLKLKKNYKPSVRQIVRDECEDLQGERLALLEDKYIELLDQEKSFPLRPPHLPGYPEWYRKLCKRQCEEDWVPEPTLIGTGLKITPKLLHLTWKGQPLHHERNHGWGYLVPMNTQIGIDKEDLIPVKNLTKYFLDSNKDKVCSCPIKHEGYQCKGKSGSNICKNDLGLSCGLVKLPHKDGPNLNVGNPLAKDFINKFSENALSADNIKAKRIIEINRMLSYWRNSRERIDSQQVFWLDTSNLPPGLQEEEFGAILPLVVVCGTLTRRAVEPTWMTASNASLERVGSELRSMIQAPPGYSLVGADVDSQELWIASLLGDSFALGAHGATPLGWMTLNGQKSDGTDMHSVSAKAVGISRNSAKTLNYARIYGASEKFTQRLLKQFNEDMTASETMEKARTMMELTKGKKIFTLKDDVLTGEICRIYTKQEAYDLCKIYNKEVEEIFERPQWFGGTESAMFNCLEMIASKQFPETPFLNSKLSRALEPHVDRFDKHTPTRINWVVQSGAVDYLHLMLVSMRWLLGKKPRFCLSFHDEVRYLVEDRHKYSVALALHVTNLLTRAFCISRVGMVDVPMSVAFFSSVESDRVLRKEAKDDNKTPSNPFGLSIGYGIPLGESLDIYTAIMKAGSQVGIKHNDFN